MLSIIRSKLKRLEVLEHELDGRRDPPSEEALRIIRAYLRRNMERQGELYARRDQGDEEANVELAQIRDERKGLSGSEFMESVTAEINELQESGELDRYPDPWADSDLN